jgi:predicted porin
MKKSLLALALLGAFAGAASAQSSVTLFGIVDLNVGIIKNNDDLNGTSTKVKRMGTDGINSSRLGFRGVEDLGSGLKAGFWLEAGVNPDTGTTNSKFFNRRSTVSLIGNFGELRLGRDYTPSFWNLTLFDPFGTNGVGSFLNLVTTLLGPNQGTNQANTLVRADNSVGYFLPAGIGGLYGQAMVAAGENGANGTQVDNKYAGGRLGWASGPFDVAVGYGRTDLDLFPAGRGDQFKQWNIGGSWDFGLAKLMGQYVESKWDPVTEKIWLIGGVVPIGQGEVHVSYSDATFTGGSIHPFQSGDDAKQFALGYVYNVSKRTAMYGTYSYLKNDGDQVLTVGSQGLGSATAGKSQGVEVGLRHAF